MKEKIFTNCFLTRTDQKGSPVQICLGLKKRGWGQNLWNGSGGKPKENETVDAAALREVQEEFRIRVSKLEKRAEIIFWLRQEETSVLMHTFLATDWDGEPIETEEMKPRWFNIDAVPFSEMWSSDQEWLPIILSGKRIKAEYTYPHEGGNVEARKIEEVETFTP
jgi:8-oxo-dGTP pyrophosphatase MutT (NUDIX family)